MLGIGSLAQLEMASKIHIVANSALRPRCRHDAEELAAANPKTLITARLRRGLIGCWMPIRPLQRLREVDLHGVSDIESPGQESADLSRERDRRGLHKEPLLQPTG